LIREDLHADSVIPIRSWNNEIIGGTYRQEIARQFNGVVYPRRQVAENKFSVLKRKFGEALKVRIYRLQIKEIKINVILYNLSRMITTLSFLVIIEEFY
jgi:hypothetical protein